MKKAVFLDRDGVLNLTIFRQGKARAPYTLDEFALLPRVKEGIQVLLEKDYLLIVVSNQPDVARGRVTREAVDIVNQRLRELIHLDDLKMCFHTEKDHCTCRKPEPGMLLEAGKDWNIDLKRSFMIGDRHSDVEAGRRAGCMTFLIGAGDHSVNVVPDYVSDDLYEASLIIAQLDQSLSMSN